MAEVWKQYTMFLIANYHKDLVRYAQAMGAGEGTKFYAVNYPNDLNGVDDTCVLFLCGDVSLRITYLELHDAIEYHKQRGLRVIRLDEDKLFFNIPKPPPEMGKDEYNRWYREQRMERARKQHKYIMDVLQDIISTDESE
jgi:hypothetical protein